MVAVSTSGANTRPLSSFQPAKANAASTAIPAAAGTQRGSARFSGARSMLRLFSSSASDGGGIAMMARSLSQGGKPAGADRLPSP